MATQNTFTLEEVAKRYELVSPDIKQIIYKPEMFALASQIGQQNGLSEVAASILASECTFVMLGFTDLKDFSTIISEKLSVPPVIASNIAKKIDMNLFTPIRDSIIKMNAMNPPQALDEDGEEAGEQRVPIKPGATSGHIRNVLEHTPPHK